MGSTKDTLALHLAESWRDRLLAEDTALQEWMNEFPSTDSQQLRALVRQARKDDVTTKADIAKGLLPRQSRAYREIFQLIKEQMNLADDTMHTSEEDEDIYKP
jgi:ribosome-associated protein